MAEDDRLSDIDMVTVNPLAGVAEISPNKRYIRFEIIIPRFVQYQNIQSSYKGFDTKNGIEVAWHIINLNLIKESEQSHVIQCIHIVKDIQNKYITEFLAQWFDKSTRQLNIITKDLPILKDFIENVIITLRWRIVKKWCKQILMGLDSLHMRSIVHRNVSCSHIFIDSGLGETYVGDLWLSNVIDDNSPNATGLTITESLVFTAPEVLRKVSISTKVNSFKF